MRNGDWTVASLLARVTTLEEALRPFAEYADGFQARVGSHCVSSNALGLLTVADLRRARSALDDRPNDYPPLRAA